MFIFGTATGTEKFAEKYKLIFEKIIAILSVVLYNISNGIKYGRVNNMAKFFEKIRSMRAVPRRYLEKRLTPIRNVHGVITRRALKLSDDEVYEFYKPYVKKLTVFSCVPDKKGDREKGTGKHYYTAGMFHQYRSTKGYYRNGIGIVSPSARTLFEEDYTTALTLFKAGFAEKSMEYLGRAVHMVQDMNCFPHISGWTYFSVGSAFHKICEWLASCMYPEFIPPMRKSEKLSQKIREYFPNSFNFGIFNRLIEYSDFEEIMFFKDIEYSVTNGLYRSEIATAGILYRFYRDSLSDRSWSVYSGMSFKGLPEITVSENGVKFSGDVLKGFYRPAYRFSGSFTFSPLNDKNGMVIERRKGGYVLRKFNPLNDRQLFKYKL